MRYLSTRENLTEPSKLHNRLEEYRTHTCHFCYRSPKNKKKNSFHAIFSLNYTNNHKKKIERNKNNIKKQQCDILVSTEIKIGCSIWIRRMVNSIQVNEWAASEIERTKYRQRERTNCLFNRGVFMNALFFSFFVLYWTQMNYC